MSEISRDEFDEMSHLEDVELVSCCSDISHTDEAAIQEDPAHTSLLQNNTKSNETENNDTEFSNKKSFDTSATLVENPEGSDTRGEPAFPPATSQMLADLVLALPAVFFMIYGILAIYHDGEPTKTKSASILRAAAPYGPSLFPIIFAAIATNLLKSIAAWKLERGIKVLDLEFLLRSRTVFSSLASPISLRMVTTSNLLIILLWALSQLGGQAPLRVIGEGYSTQDWQFSYLDTSRMVSTTEFAQSQYSGSPATSQAFIAFAAAIGAPKQIKEAKQDVFGHVKIPMLEPYNIIGRSLKDGWYQLNDSEVASKTTYSSLVGLPIIPSRGFDTNSNYQFRLNTSYLNTKCDLENSTGITQLDWSTYINDRTNSSYMSRVGISVYTDNNTLLIEDDLPRRGRKTPRRLGFTIYDNGESVVTNATCILSTTLVELEIACDRTVCNTTAIRPVSNEKKKKQTVLDEDGDGNSPAGDFLTAFVNPSLSGWTVAPMQGYLINPMSPFDIPSGASVYGIGEESFSQRFAQPLNTLWIVRCAPSNALNNLQSGNSDVTSGPVYAKTLGTRTVENPLIKVNRAWLGVLIISSMVMLLAALAAAILNTLRRGPDILDHTIRVARDSPYLDIAGSGSSMEHGGDFTRRLKHVRICLGDVRADEKLGYIAIGTMDKTVPLNRQGCERLYR